LAIRVFKQDEGRLRQIDFHLSPKFITEWLA